MAQLSDDCFAFSGPLLRLDDMVRKELGLPQAECLAADSSYSLVVAAK